jgi:hypothetical protein
MGLLSAADIRTVNDRATKDIAVPGWPGGDVRIRSISVAQRTVVERECKAGDAEWHLRLIAMSLVDAENKPLFTLEQTADLADKDAKPVLYLLGEILAFNGLTIKAVEDAEKNSEMTPN